MRRRLALPVLMLLATPAAAFDDPPPAPIPTLSATAASIDGFAPKAWRVEAKATGDLDGDGKDDAAFVLHGADPALVLKNPDGIGGDEIDTNPRILGVALAAGGGYRLAVQNATLIPRRVQPNIDDAFSADGGLSIARGSVRVAISLFANAGGWGASDVAFTFRLDDGTLRLVGYDRTDTQRNTGETETISINYLSGRMSDAKGRVDQDPKKQKTVWRKAPAAQGPTIDAIGDGIEFDPLK
ncbi:MAG: hypothetical protein DI565_04990 [Ancylobacter novellus]|uniref:VCBS repeat-containing protein n=1 Tax=Ancylobacter novellus TaxID=921 RepID=A0A2W5MDV5_ANCNO|nr:MAG: hypothetical protein DI565_04990 [Ancylobacter novellus]